MGECTGRFFSLNGQLLEIDQFDDSFLADTGYIYEVFRVMHGIPLFIEDHLARLFSSVALTGNRLHFTGDDIQLQVTLLIRANNLATGNMKIVYIQPGSLHKGLFQLYITPHQYPDIRQYLNGVSVVSLEAVRLNPNAKVMDTMLRQQANQVKEEMSAYETLLVDQFGYVTEGSRSNVFFVSDKLVLTPPVKDVLPGITRKHVIKCCCTEGIEIVEKPIDLTDTVQFRAAFLSGTSRRVLPINNIDGIPVNPSHPLVRLIQRAFAGHVADYIFNAMSRQ